VNSQPPRFPSSNGTAADRSEPVSAFDWRAAGQDTHSLDRGDISQATPIDNDVEASTIALANWCLSARHLRQSIFPSELVMGPAWDIMLDLFVLAARAERIKITSLSPITGLPSSTAGRWARKLIGEGLVERRRDPGDRRRSYINLSETGRRLMSQYFTQLASRAGPFDER
jgi:predicted transcriptional regulator